MNLTEMNNRESANRDPHRRDELPDLRERHHSLGRSFVAGRTDRRAGAGRPFWPGQSYTQTASWDGLSNVRRLAVIVRRFYRLEERARSEERFLSVVPGHRASFGTSLYSARLTRRSSSPHRSLKRAQPPVNVQLTPPPSSTAPPVTVTLVSNRNAYKSGQSVRLSMTGEKPQHGEGRDAHKRGLPIASRSADGSTVVYRSATDPLRGGCSGDIKPHHSIDLALAWSGRPNQSDISKLAPGHIYGPGRRWWFLGNDNPSASSG